MSRIAILSDIHGNLPALEAVIADAEAQGCTGFANLGDSLSGPLWPVETADLLMAQGWPTIAGNHERQLLTLDRARMGGERRLYPRSARRSALRLAGKLATDHQPVAGRAALPRDADQ
jgi:predicted phosphodiesterase